MVFSARPCSRRWSRVCGEVHVPQVGEESDGKRLSQPVLDALHVLSRMMLSRADFPATSLQGFGECCALCFSP